jgi:hypothetical protein
MISSTDPRNRQSPHLENWAGLAIDAITSLNKEHI